MVAFIESHVGYLSLEVRFDCTQGLFPRVWPGKIGPTFNAPTNLISQQRARKFKKVQTKKTREIKKN